MKIQIQKKFLVFPVNTSSFPKQLSFLRDGEAVYTLTIHIDTENPCFYAYIDVGRYMGQTLQIEINPEMPISYREADEIEGAYDEPMRPQIHFTAKNGWLNDPNGLLYENGTYHLFYQHNPADVHWQNMHWGHAESRDLIHWKEKETALFPDERGMMYSGCAVLDEKNLLGKNKENKPSAVLFYTTTQPFVQNISYSDDGFQTIRHFEKNPILPPIGEKSRDPKVVFCEDLDAYIMALYIADDIFYLFTSFDLVHWEKLQEIRLPGDKECPDLFPLTASDGSRRWVFMGAKDIYLVGAFRNGKFIPEQDAAPLHFGTSAYAGQTFSGMPDGRVVRLTWQRTDIPSQRFNGQMGIPIALFLEKCAGRYYLAAKPIDELCSLYKTSTVYTDVTMPYAASLEDVPHVLHLKGTYGEGEMILSVFGRELYLNFAKNELRFGDCTAPISVTRQTLDVMVIIDKCSMEIFADGGKAYLACTKENALPDRNLCRLSLSSDKAYRLDTLLVHALSSIWEKA